MKTLETRTALTALVVLLGAHLALNVVQLFVRPAIAGDTIDCRIVDIDTYDKLPVKIADIDTSDELNVKMNRYSYNQDALKVKLVEWEERDPITVKIQK